MEDFRSNNKETCVGDNAQLYLFSKAACFWKKIQRTMCDEIVDSSFVPPHPQPPTPLLAFHKFIH